MQPFGCEAFNESPGSERKAQKRNATFPNYLDSSQFRMRHIDQE